MRAKVVLEITEGTSKDQRFEFDEHDTFVFGRSEKNCHVCLPDDTYVSRHHFILEVNPPEARLRDLGSRNGTYVNGSKYGGRGPDESRKQAVKRQYPQLDLKNGDLIKVGRTSIRVAIQSAHFPPTEHHERPPSPWCLHRPRRGRLAAARL